MEIVVVDINYIILSIVTVLLLIFPPLSKQVIGCPSLVPFLCYSFFVVSKLNAQKDELISVIGTTP